MYIGQWYVSQENEYVPSDIIVTIHHLLFV